jgi:hypothetical protein
MKTAVALTAVLALSGAEAAAGGDTAREDAIRKIHTMKVSLDFQDVRLSEAVDYLREVTGLNLVISPKVTDADAKVRLKLKDLTVKSALKLLLSPRGLAATWRDGAIVVLPQEDVQEEVTLRMYDVRAQLVKIQDFPGPKVELVSSTRPDAGIMVVHLEEPRTLLGEDVLVELVKENTGGRSWENPKSSIALVNGMLVVSQTAAIHREIQALLSKLAQYQ